MTMKGVFENIKVRKTDLVILIDNMDHNGDGYISVAEVIRNLKKWKKSVKDTGKYLRD